MDPGKIYSITRKCSAPISADPGSDRSPSQSYRSHVPPPTPSASQRLISDIATFRSNGKTPHSAENAPARADHPAGRCFPVSRS
jgi:hypothetical protein